MHLQICKCCLFNYTNTFWLPRRPSHLHHPLLFRFEPCPVHIVSNRFGFAPLGPARCLTGNFQAFSLNDIGMSAKRRIDAGNAKQNGCLIKCRLLVANLLSPNAILPPGYVKAKQFHKCAVFDGKRNVFFSTSTDAW